MPLGVQLTDTLDYFTQLNTDRLFSFIYISKGCLLNKFILHLIAYIINSSRFCIGNQRQCFLIFQAFSFKPINSLRGSEYYLFAIWGSRAVAYI